MKQMAFSRILTFVACGLTLFMLMPTLSVADQAHYAYDDLGRLTTGMSGIGIYTLLPGKAATGVQVKIQGSGGGGSVRGGLVA